MSSIDMLDLEQLDGLIIQAFGAGNIPKETAEKLESLLQKRNPSRPGFTML